MNVEVLRQTPPWEWPPNASELLLESLRDRAREPDEREAAAHLAGDLVVMNDEVAQALASVAGNRSEPESVRAAAAIAFGAVLEQTDIEGFDDDGISEPPILESTLKVVQDTLRRIHDDASEPMLVRRRALEALVRYKEDWQADAVRAAYRNPEHDWKLTAVFAMRFVPGFDKEILSAVKGSDPELKFEAVLAAGAQGVAAAWPTVESLLTTSPSAGRDLLFAAIQAAPGVSPKKARPILEDLADSDDEEIVEAAEDALSMFDPEDDSAFDD
jgi:uncharacterized protein (UPF0147 family)